MTLTLTDTPAPDENDTVTRILIDYNDRQAGASDRKPLTILLRDDRGAIVGGLVGSTFYDWLYVNILTLADPCRGRGWGTKILAAAEAEAVRRGCHSAYLDTFEFQALPFYEKQGYTRFGTLENFRGHRRFFLQKRLTQ